MNEICGESGCSFTGIAGAACYVIWQIAAKVNLYMFPHYNEKAGTSVIGGADAPTSIFVASSGINITDIIVVVGILLISVCGYARSLKDALFIYLCDLLVNEKYRGHGLGKELIQYLKTDYPGYSVYVMSGNDGYYQSIGAKKEGSLYLV